MKIAEHYEKFENQTGEYGVKCIGYFVLRSILNVLKEVVEELDDEMTTDALKQFSDICENRHNCILNFDLQACEADAAPATPPKESLEWGETIQ